MRGAHLSTWLCALALSQAAVAAQPPAASNSESVQPDQSTAAPAQSPSSTAPAASTTSSATTPKPASATPVELKAGDKDAEAQIKRLKTAGYKPVAVNGQIVFCRKELVMGSRFEEKHCGTAEQLAAEAEAGRQAAENVQRQSSIPHGN